MNDADKSKEQLIQELKALRKQLNDIGSKNSALSPEELEGSEEKFRLLAEHTPGIICVYDIDSKGYRHTVYFSPGLEKLLSEETAPKIDNDINKYMQIIHPDDIEDFQNIANKSELEESVFDYEYRVLLEGNLEKWVHSVAKCVDLDNDTKRWYCRIYDVTERKAMEEALIESEERFRRLAENARDVIYRMCLPEGHYEYASPATEPIFGYSPEEFINNPLIIRELIAPQWHDYFKVEWEALIKGNMPPFYEYQIVHGKTGELRWINQRNVLIKDADGNPIAIEGIVSDITDRKHAEEALVLEKNRIQSYIEGANVGTWEWNIQNGEIVFNDRWAEIIGYKSEELKEMGAEGFLENMHPEDKAVSDEKMALHFAGKLDLYEAEFRQKHKEGHWIWISSRGKITKRTSDGAPLLVTGTYMDITEKKQLEAKLQQTQKMESLGILAGGIAHDFNNLLVGIIGGAEMALMNLSPASPGYRDIQMVLSSAAAAADLSKQMLAYTGKGSFDVHEIDVCEIINEMIFMLKTSISKQVILKTQFAEDVHPIRADITQIRQVIMNIVINASEAIGDDGGIISIKVTEVDCKEDYKIETTLGEFLPSGHYVSVDITDTGHGMDKDTISKLFDPFFTTKFTGRGLGLSAVQGIMRGHNGAIIIDSKLEQGSTFRLLFPIIEATERDQKKTSDKTVDEKLSGIVLIVDDEKSVLGMAERMLNRMGLDVLLAENGQAALPIYRKNADKVNLVLLDMTMPGMNGVDTFRELVKINPDVKVMIASGYNEQDISSHFKEGELVGFCQKPFRYDILKKNLSVVLS